MVRLLITADELTCLAVVLVGVLWSRVVEFTTANRYNGSPVVSPELEPTFIER